MGYSPKENKTEHPLMSSWEMIPGRNHIHVVVAGTTDRLGGGCSANGQYQYRRVVLRY